MKRKQPSPEIDLESLMSFPITITISCAYDLAFTWIYDINFFKVVISQEMDLQNDNRKVKV